jgi:hypothetical protein
MSYYQVLAHEHASGAVESKPEPSSRKRARHPAGTAQGGEFIGDDPATPENEAFDTQS